MGLNRTKVELKRLQKSVPSCSACAFESNQSGIETDICKLHKIGHIEFESNQSGIETSKKKRRTPSASMFESNQSGIETLHLPILHWRGARV